MDFINKIFFIGTFYLGPSLGTPTQRAQNGGQLPMCMCPYLSHALLGYLVVHLEDSVFGSAGDAQFVPGTHADRLLAPIWKRADQIGEVIGIPTDKLTESHPTN